MITKNIHETTKDNTIIPINYIDSYQNEDIKNILSEYKFKNKSSSLYFENICVDICLGVILDYQCNILFTCPPSTMFIRKEKSLDSMANLIVNTNKFFNCYFKNEMKQKIRFKKLFSVNKKYVENKKAQHINGSRQTRTLNLNNRYYLNFWNKFYIKRFLKNKGKSIICIIDDVSSTGSTLFACKSVLTDFRDIEKDIEIVLYSLTH